MLLSYASEIGSSSATAYLTPDVLKRENLTVVTDAVVEKLLFSTNDQVTRAVGVQVSVSKDAPSCNVLANREIILSAGAISSPHLLFVSGVGPAEELLSAKIPIVKDLPAVGKHLLDVSRFYPPISPIHLIITQHITSGPVIFRSKPGLTIDSLGHSPFAASVSFTKWLLTGTGAFGRMAIQSVIFARSDDPK